MARARLRLGAAAERLRESLWLIPGVMVGAAVGLAATVATSTAPAPDIPLQKLLLPASKQAAVPLLQVLAGSVITVTSVVFSLTVVALQITAGNYSPRALRTFLRDLGTQVVLGTFLATFAYTFLVLQNVRSLPPGEAAAWAPQAAFVAVPGFALASLIALVFFIHHVTQAIRVDFILKDVLEENLDSIDTVHPSKNRNESRQRSRDVVPDDAVEVKSSSAGFVQSFGTEELLRTLQKANLAAAFRPTVGDHLVEGATIAWVWKPDGGDVSVEEHLEDDVRGAVQIGRERSMDHDVAFGIRQLVDIAVRALSPGVNDPNTAVSAILHLTVVYGCLLERDLGTRFLTDESGETRIVVPYPSLEEYLTIMVQQIGHYGREDLMVVLRLLRQLAELKKLGGSANEEVIDAAIEHIVREAEQGLDLESNIELVREAARDATEQTFQFSHYTAAG